MPFFSVVIPLYNKAQHIRQTILGVLGQTFTDFEVIIVDDGSTDQSVNVVKSIQDDRLHLFCQANSGVSAARNLGIRKAKATYIALLDADDFWYPNYLETQFESISQFSSDKVFSLAMEMQYKKRWFPLDYSIHKSAIQRVGYFEASQSHTVLSSSSAVIHISVFEEVGYFDTSLKSGQDTEMWIRMGLVFQIVFNPKMCARYQYEDRNFLPIKKALLAVGALEKFDRVSYQNKHLAEFLNRNYYAMALKSKIFGEWEEAEKFQQKIDISALAVRKRILLYLPVFCLKFVIKLRNRLTVLGLGNRVFK
ncbi:MAG: glycosyltransferase [Flavobacteriaceae bacterium]|nr:glycosyltransferase [Flavobacteriaceae bacterium]